MTSTKASSGSRIAAGPYTRPLATTTPAITASTIDRHDSASVMTAARTRAGKYRCVASHVEREGASLPGACVVTSSPASNRA